MANSAFVLELRQVCRQAITDMVEQKEKDKIDSISRADLSDQQVAILTEKIKSLPERYMYAILLRYGYDESYENISYLLDMENPRGIVRFAEELLSYALSFDSPIAPSSMKKASQNSLGSLVSGCGNPDHTASYIHKQNVENIILGKTSAHMHRLRLRRIFIAALIAALLIGATVAVMAALGYNIFKWDIFKEDGGTYVEITEVMRELTAEDYEDMRLYQPTWLPDGFAHAYSGDEQVYDLYEYYHSADGQRIVFRKRLAVEHTRFGAAEDRGEALEEIIIQGDQAFYSQREQDGRHTVFWQQDGYLFQIVSPLDKESAIRTAESVEYKK